MAPIPEAPVSLVFFNMAIPAEFFSLKREVEILLIYIAMKINWRETRFSIMKATQLSFSLHGKTIQMLCLAVVFFCIGRLFTCVDVILTFEKEITKL